MIKRADAWELLNKYTKNPNLIKHALAVEAAMRAYAKKLGGDEDQWAVTGLLHDFDYEAYPDEHPYKGKEILQEKGVSEEIIEAIQGHASFTGVPRNTQMARALFAVDELCGFVVAATLVRPGKNVTELPVKSVKKKLKDKAFARSVSRDDIHQGVQELGVELNEHIGFVITAMAGIAEELDLAGEQDIDI